jgi:hypothetical protein
MMWPVSESFSSAKYVLVNFSFYISPQLKSQTLRSCDLGGHSLVLMIM